MGREDEVMWSGVGQLVMFDKLISRTLKKKGGKNFYVGFLQTAMKMYNSVERYKDYMHVNPKIMGRRKKNLFYCVYITELQQPT